MREEMMTKNGCSDILTNYTESVKESWDRLFRAWDGKLIAIGGDSLMRNLFYSLNCVLMHLGKVDQTDVMHAAWDGQHVQVKNISQDLTPGSEAIAVTRLSATIGPHKLVIDYMRYWSFTSLCKICDDTDHDAEKCGICPVGKSINQHLWVVPFNTVAHLALGYDKVFLNMGHDMMKPGMRALIRPKVRGLYDAFRAHNVEDKLVLVEHPAQHFASVDGTGNYPGKVDGTGGYPHSEAYACDASPSGLINLPRQTAHEHNLLLAKAAREHSMNIPVCRVWEHFTAAGNYHKGKGDCTHYRESASLWAPVVRELAELSGK